MDVPMDYHVWSTMLKHYQTHTPKLANVTAEIKDHFVDDTEWFSSGVYLAHSANLPKVLYILPSVISSFFLYFFTMSKAISVSTGPIFTIFSPNGRYLREFSWSSPVFPIPQGTLPWQPILCCEQNTNHVRFSQFYTIWKRFECRWWIWIFFTYFKGRCHGNQCCFVPDSFARSRSISGSAGPIFTIFAPYGRYWMADDRNVLLFPIS